jgi:hypothetical protein
MPVGLAGLASLRHDLQLAQWLRRDRSLERWIVRKERALVLDHNRPKDVVNRCSVHALLLRFSAAPIGNCSSLSSRSGGARIDMAEDDRWAGAGSAMTLNRSSLS